MHLSVITLVVSAAVFTSARTPVLQFSITYGCYKSGELRMDILLDDDVGFYADLTKEDMVWMVPRMPRPEELHDAYEFVRFVGDQCRRILSRGEKAEPDVPIQQEVPGFSLYTRYEAEEGVANTLFCFVKYFYPPTVNITWTKNKVVVTEGVSNLRYQHNKDGTFNRISTLHFIPTEGDTYSCTVQHQALQEPVTRSWELENSESSVRPAVIFFGVSLALSLVGIGIGTLFFTKQPN